MNPDESPPTWAWSHLQQSRQLLAAQMSRFANENAGAVDTLAPLLSTLLLGLEWFLEQREAEPAADLLWQINLVWGRHGDWDNALAYSERVQTIVNDWRSKQGDMERTRLVWAAVELVKASALIGQGFWNDGFSVTQTALNDTEVTAASMQMLLLLLDQLRLATVAQPSMLSSDYLDELITRFEALGEPLLFGDVLEVVSEYWATHGDIEKALIQLKRKVDLDRQSQDIVAMISTLKTLGKVAASGGYHDQAQACFQEAASLSLEHLPESESVQAIREQADLALEQERYADAAGLYEIVIAVARRRKDFALLADTLRMYAFAVEELDQDISEILKESLELSQNIKDFAGMARSQVQLGDLAQQDEKWEQAYNHYERAIRIAEQIDDVSLLAVAWHHLGGLAQDQEIWPEARRCYEQCLQTLGPNAHSGFAAQVTQDLGRVLVKLGDLKAADTAFETSAGFWSELGDSDSYASCLFDLACVAAREGRAENARTLADMMAATLRNSASEHCAEIDDAFAYLEAILGDARQTKLLPG